MSVSCGVVCVKADVADGTIFTGDKQWVLLADPSSEEVEVEGKRETALDGLVTVACDQFGNICYANQVNFGQHATLHSFMLDQQKCYFSSS